MSSQIRKQKKKENMWMRRKKDSQTHRVRPLALRSLPLLLPILERLVQFYHCLHLHLRLPETLDPLPLLSY